MPIGFHDVLQLVIALTLIIVAFIKRKREPIIHRGGGLQRGLDLPKCFFFRVDMRR
jgi:hypothetical protein